MMKLTGILVGALALLALGLLIWDAGGYHLVALQPGLDLNGSVCDLRGRPMAQAHVRIYDLPPGSYGLRLGPESRRRFSLNGRELPFEKPSTPISLRLDLEDT